MFQWLDGEERRVGDVLAVIYKAQEGMVIMAQDNRHMARLVGT